MTFVVRRRWSPLRRLGRRTSSLVSHLSKSGCHRGVPSSPTSAQWIRSGTSCFQSDANQLAQWAVSRIVSAERKLLLTPESLVDRLRHCYVGVCLPATGGQVIPDTSYGAHAVQLVDAGAHGFMGPARQLFELPSRDGSVFLHQ